MELESLLYFAALLACPIGMGAMMWMMGKNRRNTSNQATIQQQEVARSTEERLADLRAQQQVLALEIDELSRLTALEAQRETLLAEKAG